VCSLAELELPSLSCWPSAKWNLIANEKVARRKTMSRRATCELHFKLLERERDSLRPFHASWPLSRSRDHQAQLKLSLETGRRLEPGRKWGGHSQAQFASLASLANWRQSIRRVALIGRAGGSVWANLAANCWH